MQLQGYSRLTTARVCKSHECSISGNQVDTIVVRMWSIDRFINLRMICFLWRVNILFVSICGGVVLGFEWEKNVRDCVVVATCWTFARRYRTSQRWQVKHQGWRLFQHVEYWLNLSRRNHHYVWQIGTGGWLSVVCQFFRAAPDWCHYTGFVGWWPCAIGSQDHLRWEAPRLRFRCRKHQKLVDEHRNERYKVHMGPHYLCTDRSVYIVRQV